MLMLLKNGETMGGGGYDEKTLTLVLVLLLL